MDALYPRLLVDDFGTAVAFYRGVLTDLYDVQPVKVIPEATYANWDLDGQAGLVLFGRSALAAALDQPVQDPETARHDNAMLVFKVDDVDAAVKVVERHGAELLTPPQDRPQWGPNLRTAHLRAPDGTLLELQSY